MAAGGMGRPGDRLRAPLADRRRPEPPAPPLQRPDEGRPCWVDLGPVRAEGTIHAWWRDEVSGEWHALVVAWLPSESVSPRT